MIRLTHLDALDINTCDVNHGWVSHHGDLPVPRLHDLRVVHRIGHIHGRVGFEGQRHRALAADRPQRVHIAVGPFEAHAERSERPRRQPCVEIGCGKFVGHRGERCVGGLRIAIRDAPLDPATAVMFCAEVIAVVEAKPARVEPGDAIAHAHQRPTLVQIHLLAVGTGARFGRHKRTFNILQIRIGDPRALILLDQRVKAMKRNLVQLHLGQSLEAGVVQAAAVDQFLGEPHSQERPHEQRIAPRNEHLHLGEVLARRLRRDLGRVVIHLQPLLLVFGIDVGLAVPVIRNVSRRQSQ